VLEVGAHVVQQAVRLGLRGERHAPLRGRDRSQCVEAVRVGLEVDQARVTLLLLARAFVHESDAARGGQRHECDHARDDEGPPPLPVLSGGRPLGALLDRFRDAESPW
jgi:hypothetical protein